MVETAQKIQKRAFAGTAGAGNRDKFATANL
jgi:hypothetical protein